MMNVQTMLESNTTSFYANKSKTLDNCIATNRQLWSQVFGFRNDSICNIQQGRGEPRYGKRSREMAADCFSRYGVKCAPKRWNKPELLCGASWRWDDIEWFDISRGKDRHTNQTKADGNTGTLWSRWIRCQSRIPKIEARPTSIFCAKFESKKICINIYIYKITFLNNLCLKVFWYSYGFKLKIFNKQKK